MNKDFEKDMQVAKDFLNKADIRFDGLSEPKVEPPDVIAEINGKNIGLELTEFLNNKDKIVEAEFGIIFQKVKESLTVAGISNLIIRIVPEKNKRIFRDKCINAIVETCINKYNEISSHKTLIASQPVSGIREINAFKILEKDLVITFDSRQRTFGCLKEEKLKDRIARKITCLNKSKQDYPNEHKSVNVYWLLMTIEGTFYSNYSGVCDSIISMNLENPYDKIFVFHKKHKWFEEIKIVHNKE